MAKRTIGRGRGRPASGYSYKERRILEQLARIAVKHKLDSNDFFESIKKAWNHEKARCKPLVITCRMKLKQSAVFLFTADEVIIAQFPITTTIIQGKNQLEGYAKILRAKKASQAKSCELLNPQIKDLKAGMKRINLKAKVLEVPESKMIYTRYGTTAFVSNVLITDETGSVRMSLWNDQIEMVHKDDKISITNGKVGWYRGEPQIRIGRRGSVSVNK